LLLAGALQVMQDAVPHVEVVLGDVVEKVFERVGFNQSADRDDQFSDGIRIRMSDLHAAIQLCFKQPFLSQMGDHFADDAPADPELLCQLDLLKTLTFRHSPRQNLRSQSLRNLLADTPNPLADQHLRLSPTCTTAETSLPGMLVNSCPIQFTNKNSEF